MPLRYLEDFTPGTTLELGSYTITREEILTFAHQFDPQPFHIDEARAKASLYGGLIASGWHTGALMMRMFADNFLSPASSLASPGLDELRWLLPVRPGDVLGLRVTILEARRSRTRPEQGIVRSLVEVLNQHGEVAMSLKPVSLIRCRPRP